MHGRGTWKRSSLRRFVWANAYAGFSGFRKLGTLVLGLSKMSDPRQKTRIPTNVDGPGTLEKRIWPCVYAGFPVPVTPL